MTTRDPSRKPPPATLQRPAVPYREPDPVLVAEHARAADRFGQCVLCDRPIAPGAYVATLVPGGDVVHVSCTGQQQ